MAIDVSAMLQPIQPALRAVEASGFLGLIAASVINEWCIARSPLMDQEVEYSIRRRVGVLASRIVSIIAEYAPSKIEVPNVPRLLFSSYA